MNNTYKTNKTDWRRLGRSTLLVALLMMLVGASLPAKAADYVIMAYSGGTWHFYSNNGTDNGADVNTFAYNNCVWTGSSGNTFTNGTRGLYCQSSNGANALNARTDADPFTITGNKLYYNGNNRAYICYNGGWYTSRNNNTTYTNGVSDVLYSISSPTSATITAPTITGTTVFDELRSYSYTGSNSTYTPQYYTLTGASTYYIADGGTPETNASSLQITTGITYSWTLENSASYDDGHVRISGNSVEYYNSYGTETTLTLRAVATHTASSTVSTATSQTLTFMPLIDPTSLSVTAAMTVYAGQTGNITYSLLPDPCYDNVTFASDATSVATVNASGVVTGVSTGTATITVTAYKLDGTSNSDLTKTVTVTVKDKVATPVITFTPDPSDNTQATAEITCATPGTTIYYTLNSGAETAYSSAFPVNEYDVVNAYAVKTSNPGSLWDDSDPTTNTYVSCSTGAPTISYVQSGTTATVTITAEAGATIYYTTTGSDPIVGSSASGLAPLTVNNIGNCTFKAIAKNGTCSPSAVVSKVIILSGVSGGVVTLNDREDHSWSYYSDTTLPAQMRSLNPADVKITYYGDGIMMTGSADYTASSTDYITSTHGDYKVGAKVNVGGENENTFVYYKTLERTDGSTSANPTGRCPYKPIPNPFQVRPRYKDRTVNGTTTDANDFTGWRGFQCWRLKSFTGGSVYSAASGGTALSTGAVINAETEIYFAPTAEYGMEVELEAVWAIAYVKKANGNGENAVGTNNVGYERNFCVPTTGAGYTLYTGTGKRITNANHIPVTISCYYPDGTAPDNTANSISNTATSLTADTKFENISISMTSNTLTLANYDIIIGRGCGTSTINNLQGIDGNATDLDYTIRLESGTYNQFCFIRNGGATVSGRYLVKAIMGSDYDRATGTNNKLIVSPNSTLFFAQGAGFTGSSNKDQKTFDCVFKSGTYQSSYWTEAAQNGNPESDQTIRNAYQRIAYLGQNSAQGNTYPGVRYVTVEGGEFSGMCGGRGVGSNSVNAMTPEVITFDLRIKGGTFHGAVFGGAADNPSIGSRRFIITGGEIMSWVAGGCNGTGSTTGTGATDGDSYIYVGGTTLVGGDNAMCINRTNGGQVFGAGRGLAGRASSVNHSHVAIADEAVIRNGNNNGSYPVGGNVYGGSYNGTIADVSNVYILGGTVRGSAFGGSYGNGTAIPAANVMMTGGLVTNGVYGGSNSSGAVGTTTLHIDGGTVGDGELNDGVYGGGYGSSTSVTGNVSVTLGDSPANSGGATVNGNVYGGSALGAVNTSGSNTTTVTLNKGTVNGDLFGGAYGNGATVNGKITVEMAGGNVTGGVYGGGNEAAYSPSSNHPVVNMTGGNAGNVFGGGKGPTAGVTGNPQVTLSGNAHVIGNVYGGGNAAPVSGNTSVKLQN